jgi:hypothetical protein
MPKDKPLTLDFAQPDGFKQILPLEPILSSHDTPQQHQKPTGIRSENIKKLGHFSQERARL